MLNTAIVHAQIPLFEPPVEPEATIDLHSYDYYLLMMSGGKDSIASFLDLLDRGVDPAKIEFWHHSVDGLNNSNPLMDWPVTESYNRALAKAFDIPLYFSARVGGFEREMLRENERTAPVSYELPGGEIVTTGGERGNLSTRRKFPQLSASLSTRWCSGYLKIDVSGRAITGQSRFHNKRTLVITGERAEESSARAKYKTFESHRSNAGKRVKRHVDAYRPVHAWSEKEVWAILEKHKVNPHPAYHLGWGRLSCMTCIFGSKDQWASVREIAPSRFEKIARYEQEFDVTIHRKHPVTFLADNGTPYKSLDKDMVELAMGDIYDASIFVDEWRLPSGAFGESNGPT